MEVKFSTPLTGTDIIVRSRLLEKLNNFYSYRLILLAAPAGYGKTTLLAMWKNKLLFNASVEKQPCICWLNLDEKDNDIDIFYSYFFYSFYNHPVISKNIKEKAVKIFGGCTSFHSSHLNYFINDVLKLDREIILILDGFHYINNRIILENLNVLFRYMPDNLHIVISCRAMPKMELAKQRVYGKILDLNEDMLAFTLEETEEFCKNIAGQNCREEQIKSFYRRTEGWPAGVYLMATKNLDSSAWPEESQINGEMKQVMYDYLMEEVFERLQEEYKKFLIYTSLPDQFTVKMCNFLMDSSNADAILKEIKRKRMFIYSIDVNMEWYKYHSIFCEFLRKQFTMMEESHQLLCCRKLVLWYENEKEWEEAVNWAVRGKDYKKAVSLIEKSSISIGCRGEARILHRWNCLLPREIVEKNPRLLLNSAWAASAEGQREKVQRYLQKLTILPITQRLKYEITALNSTNLSPFEPRLSEILEDCKKGVNFLKEEEFMKQLLELNIGTIYLFQGNLKESLPYFEKCQRDGIKYGRTYLSIVANQATARYHMKRGEYREAEQKSASLLMQIEDGEEIIISSKGLLYAVMAEIMLLQHRQEEALSMAKEGVELGKFSEDYWTIGENLLILAKGYRISKKPREMEEVLAELEYCIKGRNYFDLEIKTGIFLTANQIEDGKTEAARNWLKQYEFITRGGIAAVYPEVLLLNAALAIKDKQSNLAVNYLEMCETISLNSELTSVFDECEKLRKLIEKESNYSYNNITGEQYVLSLREQEILKLVGQGDSNDRIADKLCISVNTVKTHINHIFEKLEVHSRYRAVAVAEERKLLH